MKKTRLTQSFIDEIVRLLKLRMSWKRIADAIGVAESTLHGWRSTGAKAESGIHYELVIAIEETRAGLIEGYAAVVRNEALNGKVTVTTREFYARRRFGSRGYHHKNRTAQCSIGT